MIIIKLESSNEREEEFDCKFSVMELANSNVSELEMLATIMVLTKLTKTEDADFLTPEQYKIFLTKVREEFDGILKKLQQQRFDQLLRDRRN